MMRRATSVQYIKLHNRPCIFKLVMEYFNWLPTLFFGLINVQKREDLSLVQIRIFNTDLLILERLDMPSGIHFAVVGGVLSRNEGRFSFEFEGNELVTSLRDFSPRLPWPIYRITQYPFHDLVMFLYSQHITYFK